MTRTLAALLSALAALTAPLSVAAQEAAPTAPTAAAASADPADAFSAEKMWSLARLGDTAISPDGSIAAVTVTRFDIAENRGATDIWLVPVAGGPARPLTSDKAADTSPAFSPDGRSIAFLSKRGDDKESQIYIIPVDGGEARRLTQVPTGANAIKWFPDGKRIAFVTPIWTDLVEWKDQAKRLKDRADSKMSARSWDRAPLAYWDRYLDDREPHLFSVAVEGGEPQAITRLSGLSLSRRDYSASSYDISPDGLEVAFVADVDRSGIEPNYDVITIAACGCKPPRNLTEGNRADDDDPAYSPDGKWLAYTAQRIPPFYADRARLMLVDRATGAMRDLSGNFDRS
ncbi:MAG: hypothetical protein ACK5VQ_02930, partial [Gammaproteobacteria bacterium]